MYDRIMLDGMVKVGLHFTMLYSSTLTILRCPSLLQCLSKLTGKRYWLSVRTQQRG